MGRKLKAFAPARTEIAGNHVDHQHGVAVTGSLEQSMDADIELNGTNIINVKSEGYDPFSLNIDEVKDNRFDIEANKFTSKALVAGVVRAFIDMGYDISGFDVSMTSSIPYAMGLSSSAAYEVLFANILNTAFADKKVSKMKIAQIGQYAESEYYGKPCGLLDQTAISYGGIISIDFKDPSNLVVEPLDFDFGDNGISVVLVNTGAEHGDISYLYAEIPEQMKKVSNKLGVDFLGESDVDTFMQNLAKFRGTVDGKTVLRGIHYYHEINLTRARIKALKEGNGKQFMLCSGLSGSSSSRYLQNVSVSETDKTTEVVCGIVDLALDHACDGDYTNRGFGRIHGGGFGGCIQVFMPTPQLDSFTNYLCSVYDKDRIQNIKITHEGSNAWFVD